VLVLVCAAEEVGRKGAPAPPEDEEEDGETVWVMVEVVTAAEEEEEGVRVTVTVTRTVDGLLGRGMMLVDVFVRVVREGAGGGWVCWVGEEERTPIFYERSLRVS
jgi:hypothetical protein